MPTQICSYFVDYSLNEFPSDDDLKSGVLQPISDWFKVDLDKVDTKGSKVRTLCLTSNILCVMIRIYEKENNDEKVLMTLTFEMSSEIAASFGFDSDLAPPLKEMMEKRFQKSANFFPCIKRCRKHPTYLRSSDDRLIEYKFNEVLFSVQSDFQKVEIVDTTDFGKLLILDDMVNLAESDTGPYTHTLMNLPSEDYREKEVLILGGGDGGLIKELFDLKLPNGIPKYVTMVDIDEQVMIGCDKHMPSVCGEFLKKDKREGDRYKIITGCAIEFMKEAKASGRKFDYIFGDLTDTPVASDRDPVLWKFLKEIIEMGVELLKPNTGKYMTHCNGKNATSSLDAYEKMLSKVGNGKCTFERREQFVPSFMETWIFYRIMRHE